MTKQIEAILFDLDDTLCEYRQSGEDLLALAFEHEQVEPFFDIEDYQSRYNEFAEKTDSSEELRCECFAAIARDQGRDPDLGRSIAEAYANERDYSDVRPLAGVDETITALSHEYKLGIVTNGHPESQAQKLAAIGIRDAFEVVMCAGFDAPSKPDPEPFYQAISALSSSPESAVYVGDSLDSDVSGAQEAELQAVWLSNGSVSNPEPVPDYIIDSISDLKKPPWS